MAKYFNVEFPDDSVDVEEKFCLVERDGRFSNRGTFRSLSVAACSCLSQMSDSSLLLKLLCRNVFNEMSKKLSVDNMYGLFMMIVSLNARPLELSEDNINNLSNWLFVYLVEVIEHLMFMYEECLEGNYESIERLRKSVPGMHATSQSKRVIVDNEAGSSDGEASDMMVDEPVAPTSSVEKPVQKEIPNNDK